MSSVEASSSPQADRLALWSRLLWWEAGGAAGQFPFPGWPHAAHEKAVLRGSSVLFCSAFTEWCFQACNFVNVLAAQLCSWEGFLHSRNTWREVSTSAVLAGPAAAARLAPGPPWRPRGDCVIAGGVCLFTERSVNTKGQTLVAHDLGELNPAIVGELERAEGDLPGSLSPNPCACCAHPPNAAESPCPPAGKCRSQGLFHPSSLCFRSLPFSLF